MKRFLTIKCQRIIEEIYDKKEISFKDQTIFKDRYHFKKVMELLEKTEIIKVRRFFNKEGLLCVKYKLTWDGVILWEEYLKNFQ